jgi:hypothetical protein
MNVNKMNAWLKIVTIRNAGRKDVPHSSALGAIWTHAFRTEEFR